MEKILLVPDSFKGTLSSRQVCQVMAGQLRRFFPQAQVKSIPVADGGEGSVEAFLAAAGGERRTRTVTGPFGEPVEAFYGVLGDGRTAVIEMAACAGLPLAEGRLNPERATTYGVGELLLAAKEAGCTKAILGLGGSCTNDGGAGAAAALGAKFTRADGAAFLPTGGTLGEIAALDVSPVAQALQGMELTAMCDIDNPLYGEAGAAAVFAPQKGADAAMVARLDAGLRHLGQVAARCLGRDFSHLPGAGAAGGLGFGMAAFCGAQLRMGIDAVLDAVGFDSLLPGTDVVFTGEGKIDSQSARGKVVSGVAARCRKAGVPVVAVVGQIGQGFEEMYQQGLTAVFSINRAAQPFAESRFHAGENLALTMENIARLLAAGR
ncbi:MAG TPA: glycerate kinase [Candidatus Acutalibacter ornithocaccae]|uniref:Glycerate kinase n=1 Tax=Candidatus Acutalibacter ornithocaccae TaxID=2838416 RepID=A0A9D2LZT7_9FIRM|nr:glycerate kinase [Candidatus Acutalibacter ornithocaccae]